MYVTDILAVLAVGATCVSAGVTYAKNPKRGMISDLYTPTYQADVLKFTGSQVTTLSWYYSFGQYPDQKFSARYEFVMQQFGVDTTADSSGNNFKNIKQLEGQIELTKPKVLFTFLEPTNYGVSVDAAVAAWRQYIIPIRKKHPNLVVGSPSVINGDSPKVWIHEFRQKCPECVFDFLDVHYYWSYDQFQNEMNNWHTMFPNKKIWVSDLGFQNYSSSGTDSMCTLADTECLPQTKKMITWMDNTDWIHRYTYRGEFRRYGGSGNGQLGWLFLGKEGKYTDLGKWYLGIK